MMSLLVVLVHGLILVVFVNRYIAGILLRALRGRRFDEATDDFEPEVEVVIPMYNEGDGIRETIRSLVNQSYPREKLTISVVDDCSTDDSYKIASQAAAGESRVRIVRNRRNLGKRRSITSLVRESTAEIIVSVDSDVVVDPDAVRQLVRRFTSPRIAAVGGRVDIRNKHDNWLTRMQTIKYHYGYSFMKNLERSFRAVLCLSGCLTAYRRSVLLELEPVLENRNILGVPIKYGEDRYLTRQIVKAGYQTTMTMDAKCRTYAPAGLNGYFAQQLRWRRSNIIDYCAGMSHVWRLNPIVAVHYFSLFALLIAYPALVFESLATGRFFALCTVHIGIVAGFGLIYRWQARHEKPEDRVTALSFLPMVLVMPVTYAVLTPVALFTLDSGRWETRHHEESEAEASPAAVPAATKSRLVTDVTASRALTASMPGGEPAGQVASAKVRAA